MLRTILASAFAAVLVLAFCGCDVTNVEYTDNLPPYIESLDLAKTTAIMGEWVGMRLVATDPEEDLLTFTWNRTNADTSEIEAAGPIAQFRGSSDRAYTVQGVVSDGENLAYENRVIQVVAFAADFNGFDAGSQPPAPWSFETPAGPIRISDQVYHGTGGRSLEFVDYGPASEAIARVDASSLFEGADAQGAADREIAEFHVLLDGDGFVVQCYDLPGEELTNLVWDLRFDGGRIWARHPGEFRQIADSFQGSWIKVKIYMDFDNGRWSVTLNDEPRAADIGMYSETASRCDGLQFRTADQNDPGNFFIDDVVLTENESY